MKYKKGLKKEMKSAGVKRKLKSRDKTKSIEDAMESIGKGIKRKGY